MNITALTQARPHVHETARFSPKEFRAYQQGYYAGVVRAAQVAELAAEEFALRVKSLVAEARRKRSA